MKIKIQIDVSDKHYERMLEVDDWYLEKRPDAWMFEVRWSVRELLENIRACGILYGNKNVR